MGQDEALLEFITSANIACGFHAGDPATMARTVKAAVAKGVAMGAVNALTGDGLFIGQSSQFMQLLHDLASDADKAQRSGH